MCENLTRPEKQLLKKQEKCNHPSLKCSLCSKYKDLIFEERKIKIEILQFVVEQHEKLLDQHGIEYNSYEDIMQEEALQEYQKQQIDKYFKNRREVY